MSTVYQAIKWKPHKWEPVLTELVFWRSRETEINHLTKKCKIVIMTHERKKYMVPRNTILGNRSSMRSGKFL